ncbi:MAG TPA: hypothetical protein VH040_17695 [Usitatibacter sp.]|jgi:hypothetical protein|nr:hypothetical protein [Usitatibacter sp.]
MEYLLIALGGILFGVYIQGQARRARHERPKEPPVDNVARQADAFLRGIRAFERGVATQLQRERRAARLRRLMSQRSRTY